MKKIFFLSLLLICIAGCGSTQQPSDYSEWKVPDNLMGSADEAVQELQHKNPMLSSSQTPTLFQHALNDNNADLPSPDIITRYVLDKKIYDLVGVYGKNDDKNLLPRKFQIISEGKQIFQREMCFGAAGPINDFKKINNEIALTFSEPCADNENPESVGRENIYYQGKTINEEYNVEESKSLFSYKGKLGFIGKQDGVWHIFFNGQRLPYSFDLISDYACCAAPYYFEVYENGALVFLAKKQEQNYIVEIDLNTYL